MEGDEVRSILSDNIKIFRRKRDWSQADLAEKAGLSVVYLSDIERGNKWPYLDTMVKLATAFNVEVYELLKPENIPSPETASILIKYTEEVTAIFNKSLETTAKNSHRALTALMKQYLSKDTMGLSEK